MRLEKASAKAIKYACLKFHYAKAIPSALIAFSVFNKKNEWCGIVCYGLGAAANIAKPFGMVQGQVVELVRVALNGKQSTTSKVVSVSLKLIKKLCPSVKIIVSYADTEQGHKGTIYQALNWFYIRSITDTNIIINGQRKHRRSISSKYGTSSVGKLIEMGHNAKAIKTKPKHKYIYPLDKSLRRYCKSISKPYPK